MTFERGEYVWCSLDPALGHEQQKRRPCLVLSPKVFNSLGFMVIAPVTSKIKGFPFEVPVESGTVKGAVLVSHVRSIDWRVREVKKIAGSKPASFDVMQRVSALLEAILGM
ncbi:MAG: endoribonuclease MazF [Fibrobacterota bacterium]|jgi:mRNA interferase MazF